MIPWGVQRLATCSHSPPRALFKTTINQSFKMSFLEKMSLLLGSRWFLFLFSKISRLRYSPKGILKGGVFFLLLLFSFSPYIANYVHIITPSQCYRDVTPFKKTILQTVGYWMGFEIYNIMWRKIQYISPRGVWFWPFFVWIWTWYLPEWGAGAGGTQWTRRRVRRLEKQFRPNVMVSFLFNRWMLPCRPVRSNAQCRELYKGTQVEDFS